MCLINQKIIKKNFLIIFKKIQFNNNKQMNKFKQILKLHKLIVVIFKILFRYQLKNIL